MKTAEKSLNKAQLELVATTEEHAAKLRGLRGTFDKAPTPEAALAVAGAEQVASVFISRAQLRVNEAQSAYDAERRADLEKELAEINFELNDPSQKVEEFSSLLSKLHLQLELETKKVIVEQTRLGALCDRRWRLQTELAGPEGIVFSNEADRIMRLTGNCGPSSYFPQLVEAAKNAKLLSLRAEAVTPEDRALSARVAANLKRGF